MNTNDTRLMLPFDSIMAALRKAGEYNYPSPMWHRSYQFPAHYPPPTKVKNSILDPLGVFLYATEMWRDGKVTASEMEQQTAGYMIRHKAWKQDFPLYLVTPALTQMLLQTDRLEEPNIDTDSRPPFEAGFFVLPEGMVGIEGTPGHVITLSYALLRPEDAEGTAVRFPADFSGDARRFYVSIEMSNGTGYFAKLRVSEDGEVENSGSQPYEDLVTDNYQFLAPYLGSRDDESAAPAFTVKDGPALLDLCTNLVLSIFTFLNMDHESDTVELAVCTGKAKAKAKKNLPAREFWKPAVIGTNLHPTGHATQGSHASPHAHIRRGHWRRQHFGKGREQVKRIWIKPVLVMGGSATE